MAPIEKEHPAPSGLMPSTDQGPGPTASVPVNVVVGAAPPLMANAATSFSTGEPSLIAIAGGINVIVEYVKNWRWFREQAWTVPLLILMCFAVSFVIWWLLGNDLLAAIKNGFGLLVNAHFNYGGVKQMGLGILGPTAAENKFGGL